MHLNGQPSPSEPNDNKDSGASSKAASQAVDQFRRRRLGKDKMKAVTPPPPPPPPRRLASPSVPKTTITPPSPRQSEGQDDLSIEQEQPSEKQTPQAKHPEPMGELSGTHADITVPVERHTPSVETPAPTSTPTLPPKAEKVTPKKDIAQKSDPKKAQPKKAQSKKRNRKSKKTPVVAADVTLPVERKTSSRKNAAKSIFQAILYGTLPVILLGAGAFVVTNRIVADRAAKVQQIESTQIADTLNRFMVERVQDIQSVATSPLMATLLQTPSDEQVTATLRQQKKQQLEQLRLSLGQYDGLAIFDLRGRPMLQTLSAVMDEQGNADFFQAVVDSNLPQVSLPQVAKDSGQGVVYVAAPIRDRNNEPLAVMMARLPVSELTDVVASQSRSGAYALADSQGQIFMAEDLESVGQSVDTVFAPLVQSLNGAVAGRYSSAQLKNGLLLLKQLGQGNVLAEHPAESLAGTSTLAATPTTRLGWQVFSSADLSELLVAQRSAVGLVAIATLLAASATGFLAALSMSRANRLVNSKVQNMEDQLAFWQQKQVLSKERSRLLTEIVDHMRRSLREEDILNTTVSELRYALNTDRVIVYRFLDDWTGVVVAESVALGWKKILGEKVEDPLKEGLIERYRNGRVRAMNDIYTENLTHCHEDILKGFQIHASIVAPIVQNEKLIGLLCAHQCAGARQWAEEDVDLFSKLSSQLGYVLDQAALQQSQTLSVDRSRLLTEIVNTMRRSQREDEILNNTVSELRYALNTERVIVYRFHDDWNGTIVAESVALGCRKILGETVQDPMREGYVERYRNGRVRVMNDVCTENLTQCHQEILEGFQIRASIVAPILQNGQLIGLLCAHHCSAPRDWHPEDVDLFGKLATQLGFALDQAAIMRKQIRSAEKSKLLSEIVGNMRRSMTREGVLNTIVSELRYALDTDRVIVYEFHDDWNGTITAESVAAGWRKILNEKVVDPMREGFIERYRNGRVRVMNDIYTENLTQCHQDLLEGFQIRASVVAPVLQNGQLIGLLCAHQCGQARQWEAEEVDLFTQLTIQLGFALDQTTLLEYTENARKEARQEADAKTEEQRAQKEFLQRRAMELLKEVRPVSKGDLTVRARVTDDEVGTIAESYNTIIESLREIVQQVKGASQSVAETASKNESAVNSLSQDSKLQMQSINGALKQIQAMVDSIQGVSDRSRKAEEIVLSATQTIQAGDEVMDQTVSGMSAIRETVAETAKKVKRLGEASQKVSRVVSLINGFAAQTNLLALNAAVEASRAGEEGQGFRVVAEEVRDLAQQSAQATDEIAHLVEEMQAQTNDVVAAMETGTDQVVTGTRLVEASRQQLSQISEVSNHINQLVREISQAAAAQTQTSGAVSQTMEEIAAIADDTSKQSETVSHSFDHLLMVAKELQISVAQFKVN